jgi:hypothetical protein
MKCWEYFYISYRDFEWKGKDGKPRRKAVDRFRKVTVILQLVGFGSGVLAITLFSCLNFANIAPPA